jgi:micrococcal nuclease
VTRTLGVAAVALLCLVSGCAGLPVESPGDGGGTDETGAADGATLSVSVVTVVDGDTVEVRYENGTTDTVRLLGVDTPETHVENDPAEFEGVPNTTAGRDCLREAGHDATRFLTERTLGEDVTLRLDPQADRRGYYGRLLAYVVRDGENLNYALVATGHGRVYDSTFAESERFYATEDTARANATGLWSCATDATPVADGSGGLTVVRVHADAAGRDGENLNDEYVVFENRGDATLDLSGWTVTDAADHSYRFPDGTTLAPGEHLTLHTGRGADTASDRYWGASSPVWNNDGDTVTVRDRNGTVRAERGY